MKNITFIQTDTSSEHTFQIPQSICKNTHNLKIKNTTPKIKTHNAQLVWEQLLQRTYYKSLIHKDHCF
ncbi:hypothetical protein Leryth_002760, partial [Lithospermum erythrorhizon]